MLLQVLSALLHCTLVFAMMCHSPSTVASCAATVNGSQLFQNKQGQRRKALLYVLQVEYKFGVNTHNMLKELGCDITFKTYHGMAHGVSGNCSPVHAGMLAWRCVTSLEVLTAPYSPWLEFPTSEQPHCSTDISAKFCMHEQANCMHDQPRASEWWMLFPVLGLCTVLDKVLPHEGVPGSLMLCAVSHQACFTSGVQGCCVAEE